MNKTLVLAVVAASFAAGCVVWAGLNYRANVAEVERCEATGGIAVVGARGYVCLSKP